MDTAFKDLQASCIYHVSKWHFISERLRYYGPILVDKLTEHRSLRELSRLSGLSPTYLSEVKKGNVVISTNAYLELCDLL